MKTTVIMFMLLLLPGGTMANDFNNFDRVPAGGLPFPECPGTPNCVSSLAADPARRVEPFPVRESPAGSMDRLTGILRSMTRATIVTATPDRVEAQFRSLLGFVDDLLLAVSPDGEVINVRSAARTGKWDLGVNRRRVEKIRRQYMEERD